MKQCYNAKPSAYHFYVKTKILVDFHICIIVPLRISSTCPQRKVSKRWFQNGSKPTMETAEKGVKYVQS